MIYGAIAFIVIVAIYFVVKPVIDRKQYEKNVRKYGKYEANNILRQK